MSEALPAPVVNALQAAARAERTPERGALGEPLSLRLSQDGRLLAESIAERSQVPLATLLRVLIESQALAIAGIDQRPAAWIWAATQSSYGTPDDATPDQQIMASALGPANAEAAAVIEKMAGLAGVNVMRYIGEAAVERAYRDQAATMRAMLLMQRQAAT